jgi:hypothetical protein
MKCLYYLSPNLDISKKVSDGLHEASQLDWHMHVLSRNETCLAQKHFHSSNDLETLDLFRGTATVRLIGFVLSLVAVMIVLYIDYFDPAISNWTYFVFIIFTNTMEDKYSESKLVGIGRYFINSFSNVKLV